MIEEKNKQTDLYFKNTPACQKQVQTIFANDWQGLIEHKCDYHRSSDFIRIACDMNLPNILSFYQTPQASENAYADMIRTNCLSTLSSSKSIIFQKSPYDNSCKQQLNLLGERWRKVPVDQECSIFGNTIFCNKGLPPAFAALRKNPLQEEEILPTIYNTCERMGALSEKSMLFLPSDACEQALFAGATDLTAFSSEPCTLDHSQKWLTLSCKQGLPKELGRYTTREATNAAYERGLKTYCKRLGIMEKNRILFQNDNTCLSLLNEALVNDWIVATPHKCKNPQSLDSGNQLEFVCEKGLPSQITETFRGQDAPPRERAENLITQL